MNITLIAQENGVRADQFLSQSLDNLTRSAAQKLLEAGHVLRGGKALKKNDKLKEGDEITVLIPDPTEVEILPQDIPLDVVYEDEDVIVVNKPVGMVVHPAPGHPDGTLVNALMFHCGDSLSGINGERKGFPELAGQCLHARKLSFIHPRTGERLTLECQLPPYFTAPLPRCAKMQ